MLLPDPEMYGQCVYLSFLEVQLLVQNFDKLLNSLKVDKIEVLNFVIVIDIEEVKPGSFFGVTFDIIFWQKIEIFCLFLKAFCQQEQSNIFLTPALVYLCDKIFNCQ